MSRERIAKVLVGVVLAYASMTLLGMIDGQLSGHAASAAVGRQAQEAPLPQAGAAHVPASLVGVR